jgi:hypothetical protein
LTEKVKNKPYSVICVHNLTSNLRWWPRYR